MALYHVWFSTKGRKEVLSGEIASDIKRYLNETARRTGIRLLELEAAVDHMHLLVDVADDQTLPSVMHQLKGASARHIFLKYPDLKLDLGHTSLWQRGYGWRKVPAAEARSVGQYIRSQHQRPLRHLT